VQDVEYDQTNDRTIVTLADAILEGSLVTVTVSDTADIRVATTDLNDLELFADLDYDHILNSLEEVSQFLRAFEISGELDDPLPLINRSVNDLLGFADRFDDAVQSAEDNPAETLQALEGKLRETLGIPAFYVYPDAGLDNANTNKFTLPGNRTEIRTGATVQVELTVSGKTETRTSRVQDVEYDDTGGGRTIVTLADTILEGSLLTVTVSDESLVLSLSVDAQGAYLRIDLQLENLLGETLQLDLDLDADRLVTPKVLKGIGDIAIGLAFGVKLHDSSSDENLYDAYLFEGTSLEGSILAIGDNINSWAVLQPNDDGIDPLSVYIAEGAAELVVEFEAAPDSALFNDGLRPILETITTDGRVDLIASSFLTSDVTAELPLYYPTTSGPPLVVITVPSPVTSTSADVSVVDGIRLAQAENGNGEDSTPYNHILTAVENVDMFLEGIQDLLDGEVLGITLPFIGDRLAEAARFIEDLREDFVAPLRDGVESFSDPNTNQLSQLFFELLGPDGINLLLDTNDDEAVTIEDIGFTIQVDENDQFVQWDLKIGHKLQQVVGVDIDLDLGIPGLGIDIDGPVELWLGWDLDLKLGVSTKDGPYLDISDNDDLKLELAVELPTSITGKLGFLQLDAESLLGEGKYPLHAVFAVDLVSQLALKAKTTADSFTFKADGANPAVTELWFETEQASFFGSVVSSGEVPENGRLIGDLEFQLEVDETTTYYVTVAMDAYSNNFTREDLIDDINAAINDAGASGLYAAGLDGSLLTLKRNSIVRDFKVTADASNELGIPTEAESGKKSFITFGGNLPANGKLNDDVTFNLYINNTGSDVYEYEVEVVISASATEDNNSRDDLVKDITDAIELALPDDLEGQFELASGDPRMSFWELGDMGIEFGLAAEAVADLGLTLKINSDLVGEGGVFPEVSADFLMEWGIGEIENNDNNDYVGFSELGTAIMDGLKLVQFTDVSLDLGSFISDFVGPVLDQVKKITEPVQPVIDFLTAPIPVISDLGPTVTMLDIAGIFGNVSSGFITAIADVITLINSIPTDTDSVLINFGNFVIYNRAEGTNDDYDLSDPKTLQNLNKLDNWDKDFDFDKAMQGKPPSKTSKFTKTVNKSEGFSFPILEDASQVFGMLVGKPATLMTYDLPDLSLEFTYEQYFPIFGPLGASITGSIGATIDFHEIGFDTSGIIRFADSGFRNPMLIFDGFYISDLDKAGNDVPEVTLFGGLSAAAEINAVVVSAGVAGGIYAEIEFDLYDPDEDGKVRVSEIIGSVINEYRFGKPMLSPLAMFDISGEVYARLFAFFEIDLFFFSIRKEFNILPPITILSFDFPFTRAPYLATELPGGVLQVNAGEFAGERKNVNDQDGAEYFVVKASPGAVTVTALGFSQKYTPDGAFDTIVLPTGKGMTFFT